MSKVELDENMFVAYMALAAIDIGLDDDTIRKLQKKLTEYLKTKTRKEAVEAYYTLASR